MKPGSIDQYLLHVTHFYSCMSISPPQWKCMPRFQAMRRRLTGLSIAKRDRKQPVTFDLGMKIIDSIPDSREDKLAFCSVLATGICGLFRLGELIVKNKRDFDPKKIVRVGHIQFPVRADGTEYMTIFLPYSKTDKYGIGITIVIPSNPNLQYCPVNLVKQLIQGRDVTEPAFIWPNGVMMTKASFIRMLRKQLKVLNIDYAQYSGHSLRRGGAVSAKASGASEELIKVLGRWSSDAYKLYLHHIPSHVQHLNGLLDAMNLVQQS